VLRIKFDVFSTLGSLLTAIASTIQAKKAYQQLISPRPNSSVTPSAPRGAKVLVIAFANFYLNTPMINPKCMRLHVNIIPNKIIIHNNLCDIVTPDGWLYIKI
jgi:hypothetical protein